MYGILCSLFLFLIIFGGISTVFAETDTIIPDWFKTTSYWWGTDQISDIDFLPGLEYLIKKEIIILPVVSDVTDDDDFIPDRIKNDAKDFGENKISKEEFSNSLQFLISNIGFIGVNDISYPHGIFALTLPNTPDATMEKLSSHPHVHGVTLRSSWGLLEPSPGVYDWSSLDDSIKIVEKNDKKIKLIILTGWRVPSWIYDDVPYFESNDRKKTIVNPVFWNENYLQKYELFVKNVFEKYNDHPNVVGITIAGPSAAPAEMHMAKDWPECALVDSDVCYTKEKWIFAWKQSLDFFDEYSDKAFGVAISDPFHGKSQWKVEIIDYAIEHYPDKIFLQYNGHQEIANTVDSFSNYSLLTKKYSKSVPVGAQMIQSITNFPKYGDLYNIFNASDVHSSFSFLEVYSQDILNENMKDVLEYGYSIFND